tara:strand:+ start:147 stop:1634 length:1488 start_codon:yes stop_codon:yes gene_type:complete
MNEPLDATIVKIEEDKQLVFGWANIIKTAEGMMLLDRQDDFIDDENELEKAAYHYVLHSRDGGEMHLRKGVSTLVESVVLTDEKQRALGIPPNTVPTGWWIGFKVNDDSVWKQIKKGGYVGFSVHGTGRRERTPLDLNNYTDIGKEAPVRERISKYIKQKPNGKWCVYSESGKLLSEHNTKAEAQKRLAQIEHFKKEQPTSSDVHVDSTEWDRKRRKKRILTNAALEKFNPNHDERGRFSSGPGGGGGGGARNKRISEHRAQQASDRTHRERKEFAAKHGIDRQAVSDKEIDRLMATTLPKGRRHKGVELHGTLKQGTKVVVRHKGKDVQGTIVRLGRGGSSGVGVDSYVVDVGEQRSIWKRPDEMRRGGLGTRKPKGAGFLEAKPGGKPMREYETPHPDAKSGQVIADLGRGKKPGGYSPGNSPKEQEVAAVRRRKQIAEAKARPKAQRKVKRKRKLSDKQIERITGAKGGVDPKTGQPREGDMDWAADYLRDG